MKTAVEWLHSELQKKFPKETTEMYNNNQLGYEDIILKAKEMEKDQTINFGQEIVDDIAYDSQVKEWVVDKYKETFKSE